MYIYFTVYLTFVCISVAAKEILGCDRFNLFGDLNTQKYYGIYYVVVFCSIYCIGFFLITFFHFKAGKKLRRDLDFEEKLLLNASPRLLDSWFASDSSVEESQSWEESSSHSDKEVDFFKEEKRYLKTVKVYVALVIPSLVLRALFVVLDLTFANDILNDICNWLQMASFLYSETLSKSEMVFFIFTNVEFKLTLVRPIRALKNCIKGDDEEWLDYN